MEYNNLPTNCNEVIKFLKNLGFVESKKHGVGGHQYKYYHPDRQMICYQNRPFIIVTTKIWKRIIQKIIKKVKTCYCFSDQEIQKALND